MFGGIPEKEIDDLQEFWKAFSGLRDTLFSKNSPINSNLIVDHINATIKEHESVQKFVKGFNTAFGNLDNYLKTELLTNMLTVKINREKTVLSDDVFKRLENIMLIDKYEAYQLLDNEWDVIKVDLEIIQTEGFESTKKVDPNIVTRKKDGIDQEVQDGWLGRVMPFLLVQETYLKEELKSLRVKENKVSEIATELEEIIDSLTEEDRESSILNESNDAFVVKELYEYLKEIFADVESEEINGLKGYQKLFENKAKKPEKENYIKSHKVVNWSKMDASNDNTYSKATVNKYLFELQSNFKFPDDSFESKMVKTSTLLAEEKELKSQIKVETTALHLKTKDTIEKLRDEQVFELLELKWIVPVVSSIQNLPETIITKLSNKVQTLADKYAITYSDVAKEIKEAESTLSKLIGDLEGNEFDMKGLNELKSLLNRKQ
jgi:type I restriction enzyme M protein